MSTCTRQAVAVEDQVAETLRRGREYLNAGATCVYPIGVSDERDISSIVEQMGGPVNVWLRGDGPALVDLHRLGVARISLAAALQHHAMAHAAWLSAALLDGDDDWIRQAQH